MTKLFEPKLSVLLGFAPQPLFFNGKGSKFDSGAQCFMAQLVFVPYVLR